MILAAATLESSALEALSAAPPLVVLVAVVWLFLRDRAIAKHEVARLYDQLVTLQHDSMEIVRENTKAIMDLREVMARMNCPYLDPPGHPHPADAARR